MGTRGTRRRPASIGRRLRWIGATLVVLEIAYLVFGNLFLRFGLLRVANGSPEAVMLDYESAYTLLPGTASIRHFRLRAQDSNIQWQLDLDHADITVDLHALVFRRMFHATRVRGEGVSFRLRRKLSDAADPLAGAFPPIEGYTDPPMKMIGPPGPPTTDADYNDVMAFLEDTEGSVREIWVDELRVLGPAHVKGRWFFKPERMMQLGPVAFDVDSGALEVGGERVLTSLDVHLLADVGVVDFRGTMAHNVRAISGRGPVHAKVTSLALARLYLGGAPAPYVDATGALHLSLHVENGRAMPGMKVFVESDHLVVSEPGALATVAFTFDARVDESRDGPVATGNLRVREATVVLASRAGEPPVIEAAHAHFRGLPRDLAAKMEIEHTDLDVPVRFPDLGWLLPRPEKGAPREIGLAGNGALRAKLDLDRLFHGSGVVDVRAPEVSVKAKQISAAARISATVGFDGLDLGAKSLVLRPSAVTADEVAVTREGRTHGGGTARIDVTAGRVDAGRARDLALTIAAKHPDLSWLAIRPSKKGGLGVAARAGEVRASVQVRRPDALFDGSPEDAAVRGTIEVSGSGDAGFEGVTLGGNVALTGVIEALDLGRRTVRLRRLHLAMRDVSVDRGSDHARGWWGDVDLAKVEGSLAHAAEVATHADVRARDGAPFLAVLVGAGQIPGWVPGLFPMNRLTASADVKRAHEIADLDLVVRSTSVDVTARMHDLGGAMDGAMLVKTAVVSIGVGFTRGESHTKVFAGEDWLKEHIEAATREEARLAAVRGAEAAPRSP